jgi:competence protein ComEC
LAVGAGAQLAVAPLLLLHFGQIPLLSPLANLVAAPLVAGATVLGSVGVLGLAPATDLAVAGASVVLAIARTAAGWPQIGWGGLVVALVVVTVVILRPSSRPILALLMSGTIAWLVLGPVSDLPDPGLVVLDVGQGDAILISGGEGLFALVDGGPDPATLAERLAEYRVRSLDLVVLTHPHADHEAGLAGLPGRLPVGRLWAESDDDAEVDAPPDLIHTFRDAGVEVVDPRVGDVYRLGSLVITALGPERRYASVNDESIVLMVEGPARSMLLSGDIETHAQDDLDGLEADVLKVPHHGGGTSEQEWLQAVRADLAVISVGPNDFGHPVPWVIDTLEEAGAEVIRTDEAGDVAVPLG